MAVAAWTDQIELDFGMIACVYIPASRRSRDRSPRRENRVREVRGWIFYVGKQAFETLWSAKLTDDSDEAPRRRQPCELRAGRLADRLC